VSRFILLDTGPLGLACSPRGIPAADQCRAWLAHLETSDALVCIPTIADYGLRRELIRLKASAKLRRLNVLTVRFGRLDIGSAAFDRASEFWADVRRGGQQTTSNEQLEADAILAGLASTVGGLGDVVTIATNNVRHLSRFSGVDAQLWSSIFCRDPKQPARSRHRPASLDPSHQPARSAMAEANRGGREAKGNAYRKGASAWHGLVS
jgi:hypothetical protein